MGRLVVVVLALSTAVAHAQPGMTPLAEPPPPPPLVHSEDAKSPNTALALSLGGTVASWGLLIAAGRSDDDDAGRMLGTAGALGAWLAPSFGHWYAHEGMSRGLGLRLGGGGVAFAGILATFAQCPIFGPDPDCEPVVGIGLMLVGAGMFVYGTVDDIATAPGAARRYNAKHGMAFSVAPMIKRDGGGVTVVGAF